MYPQIEINLPKLRHNVKKLVNLCKENSIDTIFGVTKVLAGDLKAIEVLVESGITHLADSRVENLKNMKEFNLPKVLLRLPMKNEVEEVIKY
ncbi:MAG TPA: alanine/ornithine racemase family PLP-dependent enzyme, partial [Haloplasmataceae bacterium]